jgi:uncharacterized protein YkwD
MPGGPGRDDAVGMRTRCFRSGLRSAAQVAIAALILTLLVASPAAALTHGKHARASQSCAGADTPTSNVRRIQRAMLCLHNLVRREHGLSKLHLNRDLSNVAAGHARDMVTRHFFRHLSPGHRDHMDRIAASAYKPSAGCWTAGENLFSSATARTPRQLLNAWMNSTTHRRDILHRGWHDSGSE